MAGQIGLIRLGGNSGQRRYCPVVMLFDKLVRVSGQVE